MVQDPVYLTKDGSAAHLVLNQPAKRNALSEAMWQAIPGLLADAETDGAIATLIVRGEGNTFAAGADIGEFETVYATEERATHYSNAIAEALDALADFAKPSIAMIDGACMGGGCGLALACDFRISTDQARFAITPAKLGLIYPLNDTRRLVDAVGLSAARDILFTARHLDAREALRIGLVDRLVERSELQAHVAELAGRIAVNSVSSLRALKQILARVEAGQRRDDAATRQLFLDAFRSEDFNEGYRAFLEKRAPVFRRSDQAD